MENARRLTILIPKEDTIKLKRRAYADGQTVSSLLRVLIKRELRAPIPTTSEQSPSNMFMNC